LKEQIKCEVGIENKVEIIVLLLYRFMVHLRPIPELKMSDDIVKR